MRGAHVHADFDNLGPERVLGLVEEALGVRCANICRPLSSYINRVYEVQLEEGGAVVAKFYRPGRWDEDALRDEHDFVLDLEEAQVPVVAPMQGEDDDTLFLHEGMFYAIYPRRGGRSFEECGADAWAELGRLMGRVHAVGAEYEAPSRPIMAPEHSFRENVNYILRHQAISDAGTARSYEQVCRDIERDITPLFRGTECIRIHGDCHVGNILFRPEERFHLIDFDDMAMGPPVQDLWMLLPGYAHEVHAEFSAFRAGYETFRSLDTASFRLIEPLRAMRYVHFTAWCVRQRNDRGYSRLADDFGSDSYWRRELGDLIRQRERIRSGQGE